MHGAKYPPNATGKKQKAVIDFICPKKGEERRRGLPSDNSTRQGDVDGDGGEDGDEDDDKDEEDPEAGNEVDDGKDGILKFVKYEDVENTMILNLEWTTPYACEDAKQDPETKTRHWGFFTWLVIMYVPVRVVRRSLLLFVHLSILTWNFSCNLCVEVLLIS